MWRAGGRRRGAACRRRRRDGQLGSMPGGMAAPMRSGHQQDGQGHRARVADSCKGATAARGPNQPSAGQPQQHQTNQPAATTANFEYDDNEWDIGQYFAVRFTLIQNIGISFFFVSCKAPKYLSMN